MTGSGSPAGSKRTLLIKPETARLAEVRRFVEEAAAGLPLEIEKVFDLKVAVSEACANAISYAGKQTAKLEVTAVLAPGRLTFTVTDKGEFRTPTPGRSNGDHQGLGMPLMVALVDEVTFVRKRGGGTTVSLSVEIPDQPGA